VELKTLLPRGDKRRYVEMIAEFCIDHLGIRNSRYKLAIVAVPKSENSGWVTHYDDVIVMCVNLKSRADPYELAHTICHEMIHVKQIARGLLAHVRPHIWWRGKRVREKSIPYLKRPWELQALREQSILVREFEKHCTSQVKRDRMKARKARRKR
jgi:hypothetical protein